MSNSMTREEAIAYLEELGHSVDICYTCPEGCPPRHDCTLWAVINYLKRPLGERLIEVLREVREE